MPDVELKLKVTAEGQAALDTVAKSVAAVGQASGLTGNQLNLFNATLKTLVTSGQTTQQALQGMAASAGALGPAIATAAQAAVAQAQATQAATTATQTAIPVTQAATAATQAHTVAQQQLAATMSGHTVPQVAAAGAAFRELEGQMSIRAVERFAVNILGLGPLLQAVFPIVGAIAFFEVIGKGAAKLDPMTEATKKLAEANKTLDASFTQLEKTLERYNVEDATKQLGRAAGLRVQASGGITDIYELDAAIKNKKEDVAKTQAKLNEAQNGAASPVGGIVGAFLNNRLTGSRSYDLMRQEKELAELELQRTAAAKGVKKDKDAATEIDNKKDAKAAKPINSERIALQNELANLQANELTGLDKINAKRDAMIQHLTEEKKLNAENLALVMEIAKVENQLGFNKALLVGKKDAAELSRKAGTESDSKILKADEFNIGNLDKAVKKTLTGDEKDIASALKVMFAGDATDADSVRRGLQTTIRGTSRAAGNGQITPGAASADNYQARVAAAQEIFTIETRHLDQIDDAGKREEALATARKKYADEIFQAEAQHTEDLAAMRQKSLEEYKTFAVGLFNAGLAGNGAPQQFLKGFGKQILDKAVGNAAGLTFDTVTKSLPQIPGQTNQQGGLTTLGKILQGTPLGTKGEDKGVAATTHLTTSTETLRTSVDKLTAVMQGQTVDGNPSVLAGGDLSGIAGVSTGIFPDGLPMSTGPYGATAALNQSGLVGLGSSSSKSYSGFSGFTGGLAHTGDLQGIFTGVSTKADGTGETLSSSERAGAAVGTAGVLVTGGEAAYAGFKKGGAKGTLQGISATAGTAAALDPEPISKMVLASVAMVTGLAASIVGDPKAIREAAINKSIAENKYLAPTAINTTQSGDGSLLSFGARGDLRTSSLSAIPNVLEPYITSNRTTGTNTFYDAPGGVGGPSGSAGGNGVAPTSNAGITIHINAIDTQTGVDFLLKNHQAIGDSLATHLQTNEGRAANAIRFIAQ